MISQDIRRNFLKYFKDRGHAVVSSSSVVPHEDPTLLFTNAGMNQFKDAFLGKSQRDYSRATTSQKCIRVGGKHNDLDNVGHTARHLTFFEMLGNFSFGDYFKEEAIAYAWQVTTEVFCFPEDKVWITIFTEDDEAFELWRKIVPEKKIVRMGEKDNFWAMGDTGPCGPCSELYFDRGLAYGTASSPLEDAAGTRYMEFWNLVFMQFNRDATGKMQKLPKQSIDTGSGLERVVSLKMDVQDVFATDVLRSLIAEIENVFGKKYDPTDTMYAPAFHVIADHIRSLSFAIADGAQPSNIERGYVLRKILRRAVRYGKGLGKQGPFLAQILPRLVDLMGADYPELVSSEGRIAEILTLEEEAFFRTLKRGGNILQQVIEKAQASPLKQISGEESFKLKDTYGFPLEEILLIAKDTGLEVNLESYQLLEEKAKEKSRSAQVMHLQEVEEGLFKDYVSAHGKCEFVGFTQTELEATVMALVVDGKFVNAMEAGQEGLILLNKTPFYAEKGGQIADTGELSHHKAHFSVTACHSPYPDVVVHVGRLEKGTIIIGEPIKAAIDLEKRSRIACNHTATHLLHYALQKVLGDHIRQAGSLVETNRLRFDFSHHKALTEEEIKQIETMVNEKIRENRPVSTYKLSYEDAQKKKEIKQFFGDKYGSKVRVVDIDYSKELCGGTHTSQVGNIGLFRIAKEGSVAAGMRRIEALTGKDAEDFMYGEEKLLQECSLLVKTNAAKLKEKLLSLLEENESFATQIKTIKRSSIRDLAKNLLGTKLQSIGSALFLGEVVALNAEDLPLLADDLIGHAPNIALCLATQQEGKCHILIRLGSALTQKGLHAGNLIKEIAPHIGGKGGGRQDIAQAGGTNPAGLAKVWQTIQTHLK